MSSYVHGYSPAEQRRLVEQAAYWRDRLIAPSLDYAAGERVLEIGCAAGAALGVIATAHPGLELAGIDLEPSQIDCARQHLASLGQHGADLRVGNAQRLPWRDACFDHVFIMWLLEHLADPRGVLSEARRVLVPGGTIVVIETDYASFLTYPECADYEYLRRAQYDLFAENGNPIAGRMLGALLVGAGFGNVQSVVRGFHFVNRPESDELHRHVDYVCAFLEPAIPQMVASLGRNRDRLEAGLQFLRSLPDRSAATFTQIIYRAWGRA